MCALWVFVDPQTIYMNGMDWTYVMARTLMSSSDFTLGVGFLHSPRCAARSLVPRFLHHTKSYVLHYLHWSMVSVELDACPRIISNHIYKYTNYAAQ